MINRVLIRIKVVQLLYSYLLVESQFNLESQPVNPTREKRFAYSLYLDLLYLLTRVVAEMQPHKRVEPLGKTRFIRRIMADERIVALAKKYDVAPSPFRAAEKQIAEEILESGLYKNFTKKRDDNGDGNRENEAVWEEIFRLFVINNPVVQSAVREMENYSLRGVDRAVEMMKNTFTNFFASGDNLNVALNTLRKSMESARELYFRLLQLPVDLTRLRDIEIEENRKKYLLTDEDRNPNMRFVDNEFVKLLASDTHVDDGVQKFAASWLPDDQPMLKQLLKAIMASDIYKEYMEFPATDLRNDAEFWRAIFKNVILCNPDFLETLEDKSVFWNDDLDIIGTFVLKTFRRIADGKEENPVLPMYKDAEDEQFGAQLFRYVIENKEDYRLMVDETLNRSQWEMERLAFMDVVVVLCALAEILNFPKIPLVVSINEYVEIAKCYSTAKSGQFVNGLLAGILEKLRNEGKLLKK